MRAITGWSGLCGIIGMLAAGVVGCGGGGGPATTVDLPAAQRHKLRAVPAPSLAIKLPSEHTFNIHDKRWGSTPGPAGKANPAADAAPEGTAFCRADAENGGASWAEFQLGHALENDTDQPIGAELRLTIDYEYACRAAGQGTKTAGAFAIKAFVKGTDGKVLNTIPLAGHTSDDGPVRWSGSERTLTELTLQPRRGYYIVVGGRADAAAAEKASSIAEITVKSLALEIVFKPATATTSAEKPHCSEK